MASFTAAQFRSLIDAINLIETVVIDDKEDGKQVNEEADVDSDAKSKQFKNRFRAKDKETVRKQIASDQQKKVDDAATKWGNWDGKKKTG